MHGHSDMAIYRHAMSHICNIYGHSVSGSLSPARITLYRLIALEHAVCNNICLKCISQPSRALCACVALSFSAGPLGATRTTYLPPAIFHHIKEEVKVLYLLSLAMLERTFLAGANMVWACWGW